MTSFADFEKLYRDLTNEVAQLRQRSAEYERLQALNVQLREAFHLRTTTNSAWTQMTMPLVITASNILTMPKEEQIPEWSARETYAKGAYVMRRFAVNKYYIFVLENDTDCRPWAPGNLDDNNPWVPVKESTIDPIVVRRQDAVVRNTAQQALSYATQDGVQRAIRDVANGIERRAKIEGGLSFVVGQTNAKMVMSAWDLVQWATQNTSSETHKLLIVAVVIVLGMALYSGIFIDLAHIWSSHELAKQRTVAQQATIQEFASTVRAVLNAWANNTPVGLAVEAARIGIVEGRRLIGY